MTDWEDASYDEVGTAAKRGIAEAEYVLHLEALADLATVAESTDVPMPNTAHPAFASSAKGMRALIAQGHHSIHYVKPRRAAIWDLSDDLADDMAGPAFKTGVLTVRMCQGFAPYVGEPFVYVWKVAVDDAKRWVATDSWPEYHPDEPWRRR